MAESDNGCIVAGSEDILTKILLLLPAEDAINSKFVCRKWRSLISGEQFRRLYRRRQQSFLFPMITGYSRFNPITNGGMTPYVFPLPNLSIKSSCNGLMVVQSNLNFFVFNAATKQLRQLILTRNLKYHHVVGLHLAYDPLKSPHYKIASIRVQLGRGDNRTQLYWIELYDSETRAWDNCIAPFVGSAQMDYSYGAYWQNKIFGTTLLGSIFYLDIYLRAIRFLPRPPPPRSKHPSAVYCGSPLIQESDGYLYYLSMVSDPIGESLALWELSKNEDESGFSWILKYHDRVGNLPRKYGNELLGFVRGEKNTLMILLVPERMIVCYSFVDKVFKQLLVHGNDIRLWSTRNVHPYCETL